MNAPLLEQGSRRLFISIVLLAVVLRLWGIWHGYPYSYYSDEAHFVKRALSFGSGDLNPHWFHKPAFYMYILFCEYSLYFLFGKIVGLWPSMSEFAVSYIKNPGAFYLIGRFTTVLFSLGSIWVVYRIGEKHFRKNTGIVAALLLSLSYGHVAASQDIKADTPAMFFAILSVLFLLNYVQKEKNRDLILAAAFAGLGTATKYYPIVMLMPIVLGVILVHCSAEVSFAGRTSKIARLVALVFIAFSLFYFICSPYNFFDPLGRQTTFKPVSSLVSKISQIFGPEKIERSGDFIGQRMGILPGAINYFKVLISKTGMGIIIGTISILGFCYLFSKMNKQYFLFLFYPAVFMLTSVFLYPGYAEPRHQLPIYPFLALTGAALIVCFAKSKRLASSPVHIGVIVSLLLLYPLYNIVDRAISVSEEDTRNIAKYWIEQNIPSETKILVDENGPQLLMSEKRINKILENAEQADPNGQFTAHYDTYLKYQLLAAKGVVTYNLHYIRFPWWREREVQSGIHELTSDYDRDMGNPLKHVGVGPYDYYVDNGFEYAVVHNNAYRKFMVDNLVSKNFPSLTKFYRELFERGKLIKLISPLTGNKTRGPEIRIYNFEAE